MLSSNRWIFFVCCSISSGGELLSYVIPASTPEEASDLFLNQYSVKAQSILGPFYKKMTRVLETTRSLKFSSIIKKAQYNDWLVNAFLLKDPPEHAYLVITGRTDNKTISFPKGTIVVPISDLRFVDE